MKKAYIITIKGSNIAIFVRYFENGFVESYHYQTPADPPEQAQAAIKKHFPFYISDLKFYKDNKKVFELKPVTPDLSFKKFWDTYAHKQGKKARAERLWKQLSLTERARAMEYIKKYDNFLYLNKGISKAYPETYLSQKRWENED